MYMYLKKFKKSFISFILLALDKHLPLILEANECNWRNLLKPYSFFPFYMLYLKKTSYVSNHQSYLENYSLKFELLLMISKQYSF